MNTSTIERPVTHTPAELRADYTSMCAYHPDYGRSADRWPGARDWFRPVTAYYETAAVSSGPTLAARLHEMALYQNDEHDAYVEYQTREGNDHSTISTYERDQLAALQQAELLGATADQRHKLRAIVEAEHTARAEVTRLTAEVERLSAPLEMNDRRVWDIFGKAAAEADRQGYCSVYDQISAAVGIPNRDELRENSYLESPTWEVEFRVTSYAYVTVTVDAGSYDEAARNATDEFSADDLLELADFDSNNTETAFTDANRSES